MLIKNLLSSMRTNVAEALHRTRLQQKYPTSRFYPGVYVDERSSLGRYNVLFAQATVVNSTVADHTFIQKQSTVLNADIGKFCSIAAGVRIGLGNHPIDMVSTHPAFYAVSQPIAKTYSQADVHESFKRINIGHDVWIGERAIILDGVTVGDGAVIGAGAVVTKSVEPYAVVGGVPATLIKYRFEKDVREQLSAMKWWDRSDEWLQKNAASFINVQQLITQQGQGGHE